MPLPGYLTKPFSPRELVARIRAVLRRLSPPSPAGDTARERPVLRHNRLLLDIEALRAT